MVTEVLESNNTQQTGENSSQRRMTKRGHFFPLCLSVSLCKPWMDLGEICCTAYIASLRNSWNILHHPGILEFSNCLQVLQMSETGTDSDKIQQLLSLTRL